MAFETEIKNSNINNALQRSDEDIENLLVQYKPLVIKIARQYFLMGGDIDDLVQEGMIGLYKAIKTFDDSKNASLKTFATLCIKRQIQSTVKKSNALKNNVFNDLFDDKILEIIDRPSAKENPEERAISKQKYEYINNEIHSKLSNFEREVLKKYLAGLSYNDISKEFNVTIKSIDNALSRIRTKLCFLLNDTNY